MSAQTRTISLSLAENKVCPLKSHTVEQAVECLLSIMPKAEQRAFAAIPEARLIENHLSLALWVRNNFGLWTGNDALLADTGALDADGASAVIVRAFWQRLQRRIQP